MPTGVPSVVPVPPTPEASGPWRQPRRSLVQPPGGRLGSVVDPTEGSHTSEHTGAAAVGTSELSLDRLRGVVAGARTPLNGSAVRATFADCPCVDVIPEVFEWQR